MIQSDGNHDGHHHSDGSAHAAMWLVRRHRRPVHRVGRRQFLTELGRNTVAIAVFGGFVAACAGDDDATVSPATTARPGSAFTDDAATDSSWQWAQAQLGSVSAYVLVRGSEAVVVDTGNPGSADQIGVALGTLGATFDDVGHVVLTHSHPDHVGSLPEVLDRSASATVYAGEADIPNISAPVDVTAVGSGDDVRGLQIVDSPGHTPGSISIFDPGIGLLVAGDALNGTDDGTALTGPNERFTGDMVAAITSVGRLAELDPESVAMGHGQPVTSGAGPLLTSLAAEL